jgi:hypothetical protein
VLIPEPLEFAPRAEAELQTFFTDGRYVEISGCKTSRFFFIHAQPISKRSLDLQAQPVSAASSLQTEYFNEH